MDNPEKPTALGTQDTGRRQTQTNTTQKTNVEFSLFPPIWHFSWNVQYVNNKNVDIAYSSHNAFLEKPSSGTLKAKKLESQIFFLTFGGITPKGPKQDSQNRLRSHMPEGGEP